MRKALVVYQSITGNTEKVAKSIHSGLCDGGFESTLRTIKDAAEDDFYNFDLVCFGAPSYNWHVPKQTDDFLKQSSTSIRKIAR